MVRRVLVAWMLAACAWCTGGVRAQLDQPDAGTAYRVLWEGAPDVLWEAVTDLRSVSPAWRPERESSKVLVQHLELVERLADATRLEAHGVERPGTEQWDQGGADARNFRRTAYLFAVEATRLVAEGNADGAAGRLAAIVRLADQLAADGRPESVALAVTCIELVDEQVDAVCGHPSLSERGRRELWVGLAQLDDRDPVGILRMFKRVYALGAWVRANCVGEGAGETLVAALPIPEDRKRADAGQGEMMERRRGMRRGQSWPSRQLIAEIRAMDETSLHQAASQCDRMVTIVLETWEQPDAEGVLRSIDFNADRGVHGPLARLAPQGFSRQRRTADRVETALTRIGVALLAGGR